MRKATTMGGLHTPQSDGPPAQAVAACYLRRSLLLLRCPHCLSLSLLLLRGRRSLLLLRPDRRSLLQLLARSLLLLLRARRSLLLLLLRRLPRRLPPSSSSDAAAVSAWFASLAIRSSSCCRRRWASVRVSCWIFFASCSCIMRFNRSWGVSLARSTGLAGATATAALRE